MTNILTMRKLLLLNSLIAVLFSCKDRDREIDVEVKFKGTGNGEFEICFSEKGKGQFDPEDLGYHIYVTTKNGLTSDVERDIIIETCEDDDMCQYKKLGAYSDKDYEDMKTNLVPGNIRKVKVEIFYLGEYDKPFITKELTNL